MNVFDARLTDVNLSWNKNFGTNDLTVKTKDIGETSDNVWSKCYKQNAKFTLSIFTLILLILTHVLFFTLYPIWILISMNIMFIDPAIIIYTCADSQAQAHVILLHFCAFANFLNYVQHKKDLKYLYFVISGIIAIHVLFSRSKHKLPISPLHYLVILINILGALLLKFVPTDHGVGFDVSVFLLWLFNVLIYYLCKSTQEA